MFIHFNSVQRIGYLFCEALLMKMFLNFFVSNRIILLIILAFVFQTTAQKKNYFDYTVYDVTPTSETAINILKKVRESVLGYVFLNEITGIGKPVQIMVEPSKEKIFLELNKTQNLKAGINMPSAQQFINAQMKPVELPDSPSLLDFTWDRYHNLDDINTWLRKLEETYPDIVTKVSMGKTHEGRDIMGVIVDRREGLRKHKYYGLIEGGIHPREWISPATVTWIIKELVISDDAEVKFLAEAFIWHIFPVVNPDGYAYSFSHDRMWNKNRFNDTIRSRDCFGVDLNRNFDINWMGVKTMEDLCSHDFAGRYAASEPETRAITKYVRSLRKTGTLLYYFSFHSYAQSVLFPYSHVNATQFQQRAKNFKHLTKIAKAAAEKLQKVHGYIYDYGSASELKYDVSGTSIDWVKSKEKVPVVMAFQLRDKGLFGIFLPPSHIIPNNEEIMAALVTIDKTVLSMHYYKLSNVEMVIKPILRQIKIKNSVSEAKDLSFVLLFSSFWFLDRFW